VLEYFAAYEGWMGLAGLHALGAKASGGGAATRFAAAA
jgi:DNA-3-methyladenine glycosylase II/AraC family transcriptional regulator of adaptative response / DNA-3-methyladenine glycosylase II